MKCINPSEGSLLMQYMLNLLNDEEQYRFEEHVMNCQYCQSELSMAFPEFAAAGANRKHILEALHQEGISFERLKEQLISMKRKKGKFQEYLDNLSEKITWWTRTKKIVLVTGIVAVLLLIALLPKGIKPTNPYLPLLTFDKFAYQELSTRATIPPDAINPLFSEGMKAYSIGDYKNAARVLTNAAKQTPREWSVWFFLGMSYYLDKQAKPAISALLQADSLNQYALEVEIKWYLAQAYLLNNDPKNALPYLQWLEDKPGEYSSKAKTLIKSIQ
jgi:hypothetical protein